MGRYIRKRQRKTESLIDEPEEEEEEEEGEIEIRRKLREGLVVSKSVRGGGFLDFLLTFYLHRF